jgi:hypothetical protein
MNRMKSTGKEVEILNQIAELNKKMNDIQLQAQKDANFGSSPQNSPTLLNLQKNMESFALNGNSQELLTMRQKVNFALFYYLRTIGL